MRLYAVTDRRLYPGDEPARCAALLHQAAEWARAGVAFVQLREKDLSPDALLTLARQMVEAVREASPAGHTRVLVNGPAAIARLAAADGMHLPALPPAEIAPRVLKAKLEMKLEAKAQTRGRFAVSLACHSPEDAARARDAGASVVLFAPVYEKPLDPPGKLPLPGAGIEALRQACQAAAPTPVFALGGITAGNAQVCIDAGASGVAGIRLFAGEAWRSLLLPHPSR